MNDSGSTDQKIVSHAGGVVLYQIPEPNRLEIAAMHYHKNKVTTLRIFMGTQGKNLETGWREPFNDTIEREFVAEAVSIKTPFKVEPEIRSLVYWELAQDDEEKKRIGFRPVDEAVELHLKGFRGFRLIQGSLRESRVPEHEGTKDEELLDPPEWYEARDLWSKMDSVRGFSPFVHKKAVAATVHKLCQRSGNEALAFRYGSLLEATAGIIKVRQDHTQLVRDYLDELAVNGNPK